VARPSKLTPDLQAAICLAIADKGLFRRAAAALVDIDETTLSRWYTLGSSEDAEPRYRDFFLAINRAESTFQSACHDKLAADGDVRWILSRRFPGQYGRKDNAVEMNAADDAANSAALKRSLLDKFDRLFPEKVIEVPKPDPRGGA
jgi:hypothetical protein